MVVPAISGVNLGTQFIVTVGNLDGLQQIGVQLQRIYDAWRNTGATLFNAPGSLSWQETIHAFKTVKTRMAQSLANANRVVAVMYYHDVQGAWETQEFSSIWQPLDPDYLAQKVVDRLDTRTLIATGEALASLGVQVNDAFDLIIGVTVVNDDGEPYMMVQEFGSVDGTIPARPLFMPVLEAQRHRYVQVFVDAIEKTLNGGIYQNFAAGVIA